MGGKIPIGNTPGTERRFTSYNITKNIIDGLENTTKTFSNMAELSLEFETDSVFFEIGQTILFKTEQQSPFIITYLLLLKTISLNLA